jgi:hypothetical protein
MRDNDGEFADADDLDGQLQPKCSTLDLDRTTSE